MATNNVLSTTQPVGSYFLVDSENQSSIPVVVTGGGSPGDAAYGRKYDPNSWIQGFLGGYSWRCTGQGANPPPFAIQAALSSDGVMFDAINCNDLFGSGTFFARYYQHPASSTATQVSFQIDMKLPSGIAPGFATYLQVFAANQVTLLGQVQVNLSTSWQTATITLTVAPNTAYWVAVRMNTSNVLLSRVRVVPLNATEAFFKSPFVRYQICPDDLWGHTAYGGRGLGTSTLDNQHLYWDPESQFRFRTNAREIWVETYNVMSQFNGGWIDVLVNGAKFTKIRGVQGYDMVRVALPTGEKEVTLVAGAQIVTTATTNLAAVAGCWPQAVLFDPEDSFSPLAPSQNNDCTVLYGNSKLSGFYAGGTDDNLDQLGGGIPQYFDGCMTFGQVVQKAIGTRALFRDYQAASNSIVPLAQQVLACNPTQIFWEACRNDWGGTGASTPWANIAAWSTVFQALIDLVNTNRPMCQQVLVYTSHESAEGANAAGITLANFMTELDNIAAARSGWTLPPLKCDFRPLWSIAQASNAFLTTDGIHPATLGYGMCGRTMAVTIGR